MKTTAKPKREEGYDIAVDDSLAGDSADEEDSLTSKILVILAAILAGIVLVVLAILGVRHANRRARHKGMEELNQA